MITTGLIVGLVIVAWAIAARRDRDGDQGTETNTASGAMADMPGMSSGGSATLTADQIRTFGITFGTVERRTLETEVRAVGTVAFDETRISQVTPKVGGFVEQLHVDFTGQPVRRGQPLLELYSPDLIAAQQELLLAAQLQRNMGQSSVPGFEADSANLVAAVKRRLALWDISEDQVEDILRTGRVRRTLTLHAPSSGVVVEKKVVAGQSVMAGEHLYTIADLARVWIETELRDADAANIRVGSVADVEVTGLLGRSISGRVEYVYPTLQPEARTIRARIAVGNGDGALKPGMYATVRLSTPGRTVLAVPSSAVVRTGERSLVFVDMGGGVLMTHEVTLGRVAGDFTEILGGIDAGSRVVTSAQFLIDSESNLADVMRSMAGQIGASDTGQMSEMKMPPSAPPPRR
jgi:Cu(I)/Ag(I) efflux system membrane fusion protein